MPDKDTREPHVDAPSKERALADAAPEAPAGEAVASGPAVIAAYLKLLPSSPGVYRCMVRATNKDGVGQLRSQWNRSGFQRSLIEHMDVRAV